MVSRGLTKMYFIVLAMQALLSWNLVLSSSIYVGRHAAGKISEHGPSAVSEVHTCEDRRLCRRIMNFYGVEACNSTDRNIQETVQFACPATCGFCTPGESDCQDQVEDLCTENKDWCNAGGEIEKLMKDICPRTCKACNRRPSSEQHNFVIIDG
ncbi:unnamed protein product [Porites lobata]|uniref:ShKT domain-containing protein n=1 Tax=Porites lobata TaxID=104759 RepID=A0ABN8Q5V8_9CNID|nr:unnamed protein product [Porites lobata]